MRSLAKPSPLRFLTSVTSTMDVAKEMIRSQSSNTSSPSTSSTTSSGVFGVVAEEQTNGRGTSGRRWCSNRGNLLLTVCLPQRCVASEVLPVFPLLVGLAVHAAVVKAMPTKSGEASDPSSRSGGIQCKWPNDLVWRGKKLSGTLIETEGDFLLLGIGVNVLVAPEVCDGGRPSTCLQEIAQSIGCATTVPTAAELAAGVVEEIASSLESDEPNRISWRDSVLRQYRALMDWKMVLRRRPPLSAAAVSSVATSESDPVVGCLDDEQTIQTKTASGLLHESKSEFVVPVRLNEWGHLVVRPADDPTNSAAEETMVAEYLF